MITKLFPKAALVVLSVTLSAGCQPKNPPTFIRDGQIVDRLADSQATLAACIRTQCARLEFSQALLPDYTILAGLSHVRGLDLSGSDFESLWDIAGMPKLEELNIAATRVKDISSLAGFTSLKSLNVRRLQITDFKPLRHLNNLERLILDDTDFSDLDLLQNMRGLRLLNIMNTNVGDLSALSNNSSLEKIYLRGLHLTDLRPLLSLPNLQRIDIDSNFSSLVKAAQIEALRSKGVEVVEVIPVIIE